MTPDELRVLQRDLGHKTDQPFADQIGVNVSALRSWLKGVHTPDKRNLITLTRLRAKADRMQKENTT